MNRNFGSIEHLFPLLFYPDSLGGVADITSGNKDDLDVLKEDDDKDEKDKDDTDDDKENKDDVDDKDDDDKDDEDKDKDDDEDKDKDDEDEEDKDKEEDKEDEEVDDDLKLTSTVTDIKKEFPEFFKKFPDVRAAMFREQRYAETVGTLEQAENAAKKADILDNIENDVLRQGNVVPFLETLKDSKEAFPKVMNQILPFLQKTDKDLYLEVVAVPIKQLLRAAFKEGNGNKSDLGRAALYLHHYFFNGSTDVDGTLKNEKAPSDEKSETEKRLEERLNQIEQKEYTTFKESIDSSYISKMGKEIRVTLDKDDRLSDYAKSKLVEDILVDIKEQLAGDERYNKSLDALWLQAKKSGWTNDFKSRILTTALARAKSLVPEARKKLVAQALGKKAKANTDNKDKDKDRSDNKRDDESRFRSRDRNERNRDDRREKPKKMLTDMDIIRG